MLVWRLIDPTFFKGFTLAKASYGELVLLPATGSVVPHLGLPDSGPEATVIAPDLSNLPPGYSAADVEPAELLEHEQEHDEQRRDAEDT